jgi:hypothetical protein
LRWSWSGGEQGFSRRVNLKTPADGRSSDHVEVSIQFDFFLRLLRFFCGDFSCRYDYLRGS